MAVSYEEMVEDPAAILKEVTEFLNLPFPTGKLPDIGNDSGCAAPYRKWLDAEAKSTS